MNDTLILIVSLCGLLVGVIMLIASINRERHDKTTQTQRRAKYQRGK